MQGHNSVIFNKFLGCTAITTILFQKIFITPKYTLYPFAATFISTPDPEDPCHAFCHYKQTCSEHYTSVQSYNMSSFASFSTQHDIFEANPCCSIFWCQYGICIITSFYYWLRIHIVWLFCLYVTVDGYLHCFHCLAISKNVTIKILIQIFTWVFVFTFLGEYLGVELLGYMVDLSNF